MDSALVDSTSERFLGQWKRLVSTTNWEKGQIIYNWREALRSSAAPAAEYSDDAWARRVGNVTPQHVGRLRRVYERFASASDDFPGLYWSHFQAALDWDDAEMWLEGAVHSGWSISEMRHNRWESNGGAAGQEPTDDALESTEAWDEDAEPANASGEVVAGTLGVVRAPEGGHGQDDADDDDGRQFADDEAEHEVHDTQRATARSEAVQPFADLPPLPPDVNDAFEAYKLCILRHKLAGWQEITRDDLVASLDSLKQLALAPSEG